MWAVVVPVLIIQVIGICPSDCGAGIPKSAVANHESRLIIPVTSRLDVVKSLIQENAYIPMIPSCISIKFHCLRNVDEIHTLHGGCPMAIQHN